VLRGLEKVPRRGAIVAVVVTAIAVKAKLRNPRQVAWPAVLKSATRAVAI
jgi:hypothetical protein